MDQMRDLSIRENYISRKTFSEWNDKGILRLFEHIESSKEIITYQ